MHVTERQFLQLEQKGFFIETGLYKGESEWGRWGGGGRVLPSINFIFATPKVRKLGTLYQP